MTLRFAPSLTKLLYNKFRHSNIPLAQRPLFNFKGQNKPFLKGSYCHISLKKDEFSHENYFGIFQTRFRG